jgi:hypothetical protein
LTNRPARIKRGISSGIEIAFATSWFGATADKNRAFEKFEIRKKFV